MTSPSSPLDEVADITARHALDAAEGKLTDIGPRVRNCFNDRATLLRLLAEKEAELARYGRANEKLEAAAIHAVKRAESAEAELARVKGERGLTEADIAFVKSRCDSSVGRTDPVEQKYRAIIDRLAPPDGTQAADGWLPMSKYPDNDPLVLAGLWVENTLVKMTVWEVYKVRRDDSCDQALDEYGDILTEWPWSCFEAFLILPSPPSQDRSAESGEGK